MSGEQYLDDGRSDGTILGRDSASKIAFSGGTPVAQRSGAVQDDIPSSDWTTAATSLFTSAWGFSSSLVLAAVLDMLSEIRATFVALGFWKGSS